MRIISICESSVAARSAIIEAPVFSLRIVQLIFRVLVVLIVIRGRIVVRGLTAIFIISVGSWVVFLLSRVLIALLTGIGVSVAIVGEKRSGSVRIGGLVVWNELVGARV